VSIVFKPPEFYKVQKIAISQNFFVSRGYRKMTGGGLMQLVAYGAQDVYLTGNPQITSTY